MAIYQDSIFNEIKLRIKLQEQHDEHSANRMEEKLLMWLVSDTINQSGDVDDLLYNLLERISIIRDIPYSVCCQVSNDKITPLNFYSSFDHSKLLKCPFKLSESLLARIRSEPLFLSTESFELEGFLISDKFVFEPEGISIFPFQSLYIPFGIFVFIEDDIKYPKLSTFSITLKHILHTAIEKMDKLTLLEELKNLNASFESKVRERSDKLTEANNKLKAEIKELKQKQNEIIPKLDLEALPDNIDSALLQNISHEIRTPLNGILGFSELMRKANIDNHEREKYINIIKTCGKSILKIINDVIDLSRIESGQIQIDKKEFSITKFMTEIYDYFKNDELFKQKENIELRLNINFDGSTTIESDRKLVWQILINLVGNALKFTEEGFVEIGCMIEEKKNKSGKKNLVIFVKDTGIGIEEDLKESVFQKFTKIEHDISKLYGGTGLGLTLSKELVGLLGGKLWFDSESNKGSEFYFSLPESVLTLNGNDKILTSRELKAKYNWDDKNVMIVEDDEMSYIYLKEVLKSTNINIIHAKSGIEAVEMTRDNPDIDIILMDIKLPEMDGYEATRRIKQIRESLPVIAQTAYAMADDMQKSLQVGCDDYISKPINRRRLLQTMDLFFN